MEAAEKMREEFLHLFCSSWFLSAAQADVWRCGKDKRMKKSKIIIIVLMVLVVAAMAGTAVYWVWNNRDGAPSQESSQKEDKREKGAGSGDNVRRNRGVRTLRMFRIAPGKKKEQRAVRRRRFPLRKCSSPARTVQTMK